MIKATSHALMFAALTVTALLPAAARAVPIPAYDVIETVGKIEIRQYPSHTVAEVVVEGERDAAANEAFRILFDYISGANEPKEKISMTAPVTQEKGETIAMTAPVTQEAADGKWTVRFYLPEGMTAETAPTPSDPRVRILTLPPERTAAIRFSGYLDESVLEDKEAALRAFLAERALAPQEPPVYAVYNGPFTLGPWRRNEVYFRLAP